MGKKIDWFESAIEASSYCAFFVTISVLVCMLYRYLRTCMKQREYQKRGVIFSGDPMHSWQQDGKVWQKIQTETGFQSSKLL
jgi:hypothetical protein